MIVTSVVKENWHFWVMVVVVVVRVVMVTHVAAMWDRVDYSIASTEEC